MNPDLPQAVYGYLLGATVCGGFVLYAVYRLLRGAPLLQRVKALARAEEATTVVEFPFALIILVMFTVFAWQLAFMASAHIVVDYAAFAAARSAAVIIPQDLTEKPDSEPPNALIARKSVPGGRLLSAAQDQLSNANAQLPAGFQVPGVSSLPAEYYSPKMDDLHGSAVMACYPISGLLSTNYVNPGTMTGLLKQLPGVSSLPDDMLDKITSLIGSDNSSDSSKQGMGRPVFLDFANRYLYAYMNTIVTVTPDTPTFTSGTPLTVQVQHDFQLAIPFARTILGDDANQHPDPWTRVRMLGVGRYTTITGRATMLNEGYMEKKPADAKADKVPKVLP